MLPFLSAPLGVLNAIPGNHLILLPDAPTFTIVGVTDAYLKSTHTQRETILGKGVFEAFPNSSPNQQGGLVDNLGASLREVLQHKRPHAMAELRYDMVNPLTGQLEFMVWKPINQPVLDLAGQVSYIINSVEDITERVRLREASRLVSQQQQTFLLRLSDRLRPLTDPTDIQYQAACMLGEYTGASRVGYAEDMQDGQTIVVTRNYTKGVPGIEGSYHYEDYGAELMSQLKAGHTVIRPDIAQDPSLTDGEKLAHARLQLGATLNKPLVKTGQLVAVLFLHFDGPHAFTEHELNLLEETAERTWEAVVRARAEEALRASEAQLRAIIDESPVAMALLIGPEFRIEMANPLSVAHMGKGPTVIGQLVRDAMPELENQPFLHLLTEVFTTGKVIELRASPVQIVENGILKNNYLDLFYKPLRNSAGEVYAILATSIDVTQQVSMQTELVKQKTYLQNALSIADLGTYAVDVASDNGTISENVRHWFGVPSTREPMAQVWSQVHPDDLPRVQAAINASLQSEGQRGHDLEYRVMNPALGGEVYIRSFGQVQYQDGKAQSIIGILQNVTDQVMARRNLEESEARFRTLAEQAPIFVFESDVDATVVYWNQRWREFVGQTEEEALGRDGWPKVMHPDDYDRLLTTYIRATQAKESYEVQVRVRRRDGVYRTVLFTGKPRYTSDGTFSGYIGNGIDISTQVENQLALAESEAKLRAIIDNARAAIGVYVGRDMIIENPNQIFLDILGKGPGIVGKPLWEALPELETEGQPFLAILDEVYTTSIGYSTTGTLIKIFRNGELTSNYYNFSYTPVLDQTGRTHEIVVVAIDVTEQIQVRQQLEESEARLQQLSTDLERQVQQRTGQLQASVADLRRSNENLEQFAYIASHDLQEPLRKIQQFGDLLKTRLAGSVSSEELVYLERMQSAARRMSTLIRDLLAFSRIATSQADLQPVPIGDIVRQVLETLSVAIEESRAQVEVDKLPIIQGDRLQLEQLFQNLLSNAIKFRRTSPAGELLAPEITIRARRLTKRNLPASVKPTRSAEAYHLIEVIDNGIGFEEKYLDRIFQVFQRLHGKNEFAGTGVGLAIVQKVVTNHGGVITASGKPGQGATFSVYLPI